MAQTSITLDELLSKFNLILNNQIVDVKAAEAGWVVFKNGLCIQWWSHRGSINGGWTKSTFPKAFKSKPWNIIASLVRNTNGNAYTNNISLNYYTTTATETYIYEEGASYSTYMCNLIAIGVVDTTNL